MLDVKLTDDEVILDAVGDVYMKWCDSIVRRCPNCLATGWWCPKGHGWLTNWCKGGCIACGWCDA